MKKYILLTLLLAFSLASSVKVDAISVFGKDLHFGKVFSTVKQGKTVGAVVGSKVTFDVTSPKKDAELTSGNIYTVAWKTSDKIDAYTLTLEGATNVTLGKAYNAGKVFSWLVPKDTKPGNYKLVFTDKYGNKYKSEGFKIVAPVVATPVYKFESVVGTPVTDKSYYNIDYKVISSVNPVGEFNVKLTCPSDVSAVQGEDRINKCNKTIAGTSFVKSVSKSNEYNMTLSFTNKSKASQLVTAELFANGKSYGKGINMIEVTKEVAAPVITFTSPAAGSSMYIEKVNRISWTTNSVDTNTYSVYLVGGPLGATGSIALGTTVANQKYFEFSFPNTVKPGSDYQISFSGKGATGGLSPKFNIASSTFKFTTPTASSTMYIGRMGEVRWIGSDYGVTSYSVYLIGASELAEPSTFLGTVSASQGYFVFKIPDQDVFGSAANYKIVFKADGIADKSTDVFYINFFDSTPKISKVSSSVTTIKNANTDVGVSVNVKMTIQPVGGDIPVSGTVATIVLKDAATGKTIATSKPIQVVTESGMQYFADGTTKQIEAGIVFASSSLPIGVTTNVKAYVLYLGYKYMNGGVFTNLGGGTSWMESDNYATFTMSPTSTFYRSFSIGDTGSDVNALIKFLAARNLVDGSATSFTQDVKTALGYYQSSVFISPADGEFGPITRSYITTHLNDAISTKCPQYLSTGGNLFTLNPCGIDVTMTDGAGDKNFSVTILASSTNAVYSYATYGYGVGLPTYGILGGSSGGSIGNKTLNLNFSDQILSANGSSPRVYRGYLPIRISVDGSWNDTNSLNFPFIVRVNPAN